MVKGATHIDGLKMLTVNSEHAYLANVEQSNGLLESMCGSDRHSKIF